MVFIGQVDADIHGSGHWHDAEQTHCMQVSFEARGVVQVLFEMVPPQLSTSATVAELNNVVFA